MKSMRHLRPLLLTSLFLISAIAFAEKSKGRSLSQLNAAANVLRVVIDEGTFCGLKAEEAKDLIEPLHAMLDQEIQKIGKPEKYFQGQTHCDQNCECGLVVDILERVSLEKLSKNEKSSLAMIQAKASQMTGAQAVACARRNTWFCKSPLLKELRKQAPGTQ